MKKLKELQVGDLFALNDKFLHTENEIYCLVEKKARRGKRYRNHYGCIKLTDKISKPTTYLNKNQNVYTSLYIDFVSEMQQ